MTYAVDAEKSYDVGDYRYYLRRIRGLATVSRRLLSGNDVDPLVMEEDVLAEELPAELKPAYVNLLNDELPLSA